MKKETRKKLLSGVLSVAQVLTPATAAVILTGCPNETTKPEVAKEQSAVISIFGGTHYATVKGTMTDSEWAGVANQIANIISEWFGNRPSIGQDQYRNRFEKHEIIFNIETDPADYDNMKTTGDGKTIYIKLSSISWDHLVNGMWYIYSYMTETAKVIQPVPKYNRAVMLRDNRIASKLVRQRLG